MRISHELAVVFGVLALLVSGCHGWYLDKSCSGEYRPFVISTMKKARAFASEGRYLLNDLKHGNDDNSPSQKGLYPAKVKLMRQFYGNTYDEKTKSFDSKGKAFLTIDKILKHSMAISKGDPQPDPPKPPRNAFGGRVTYAGLKSTDLVVYCSLDRLEIGMDCEGKAKPGWFCDTSVNLLFELKGTGRAHHRCLSQKIDLANGIKKPGLRAFNINVDSKEDEDGKVWEWPKQIQFCQPTLDETLHHPIQSIDDIKDASGLARIKQEYFDGLRIGGQGKTETDALLLLASTLLHELTHTMPLDELTRDHAYGWPKSMALSGGELAQNNADSFAFFTLVARMIQGAVHGEALTANDDGLIVPVDRGVVTKRSPGDERLIRSNVTGQGLRDYDFEDDDNDVFADKGDTTVSGEQRRDGGAGDMAGGSPFGSNSRPFVSTSGRPKLKDLVGASTSTLQSRTAGAPGPFGVSASLLLSKSGSSAQAHPGKGASSSSSTSSGPHGMSPTHPHARPSKMSSSSHHSRKRSSTDRRVKPSGSTHLATATTKPHPASRTTSQQYLTRTTSGSTDLVPIAIYTVTKPSSTATVTYVGERSQATTTASKDSVVAGGWFWTCKGSACDKNEKKKHHHTEVGGWLLGSAWKPKRPTGVPPPKGPPPPKPPPKGDGKNHPVPVPPPHSASTTCAAQVTSACRTINSVLVANGQTTTATLTTSCSTITACSASLTGATTSTTSFYFPGGPIQVFVQPDLFGGYDVQQSVLSAILADTTDPVRSGGIVVPLSNHKSTSTTSTTQKKTVQATTTSQTKKPTLPTALSCTKGGAAWFSPKVWCDCSGTTYAPPAPTKGQSESDVNCYFAAGLPIPLIIHPKKTAAVPSNTLSPGACVALNANDMYYARCMCPHVIAKPLKATTTPAEFLNCAYTLEPATNYDARKTKVPITTHDGASAAKTSISKPPPATTMVTSATTTSGTPPECRGRKDCAI